MKNLLTIALPLLTIFIFLDCAKQEPFDNANVMQINNVGLRRDVFVRRYKMTSAYGQQKSFTPAVLREFIATVLEPDYLLIQNAYDKGMHKDPDIQQKMRDYKINTLANSHPIKSKVLEISSAQLHEFYQKKSFLYDVDLVLTNSWMMTEETHRHIIAGGKIEPPREGREFTFPRLQQYRDLTFGQMTIHPAVLERMEKMQPGEVSDPIYNSGMWTIIALQRKRANRALQPLHTMEKTLLAELQGLLRYRQQIQLLDELKKKYGVEIHSEYYPAIISAHVSRENRGWIDKTKLDDADLQQTLIRVGDEAITVENFITDLNLALQNVQSRQIADKDIQHFADDYANQYLLYLDVVHNDFLLDELVVDRLVNKEHRLLLSHYLKTEIADRVVISDDDAREYYQKTTDRWQASFDKVSNSVKGELRNQRLQEKRQEIVDALRKKYAVRYNDALLSDLAEQLTAEKSAQAQTEPRI
ncbi:peptidyl-prolyl cis-trans isomerase [candidate division KSB1 bacterium]|nr:MAG: peptidyl-prolyl cis-trans isomerase [candidate division KSB1 bacterium]